MKTRKITAALALLGAAAAAQGADPIPLPNTPAAEATGSTVDSAARRVVRDPVTGKLRAPNADEARALDEAARGRAGTGEAAAPAAVRVQRHTSGMRSAVLGLDHMVTLRAERRPDGRLAVTHSSPALDRPAPNQLPTE